LNIINLTSIINSFTDIFHGSNDPKNNLTNRADEKTINFLLKKLTLILFLSIDQKSCDEKLMVEKFYTLNTSSVQIHVEN
jgi:hypothetical protein